MVAAAAVAVAAAATAVLLLLLLTMMAHLGEEGAVGEEAVRVIELVARAQTTDGELTESKAGVR